MSLLPPPAPIYNVGDLPGATWEEQIAYVSSQQERYHALDQVCATWLAQAALGPNTHRLPANQAWYRTALAQIARLKARIEEMQRKAQKQQPVIPEEEPGEMKQ